MYEVVALELESGKTQLGLWTRAFSEADGDDNRARAIYVRLRVERLNAERTEHQRRQLELERAEVERSRLERLQSSVHGAIDAARRDSSTFDAVRFRASVSNGALADARDLLERHPHFVHLRTDESESMLMLATKRAQPRMLELLLKKGACDWPDDSGATALSIAKRQGDMRLAELLQPVAT